MATSAQAAAVSTMKSPKAEQDADYSIEHSGLDFGYDEEQAKPVQAPVVAKAVVSNAPVPAPKATTAALV